MTSILFYITGHGLGHAVPTLEIIKAIHRSAPDICFHINTSAPEPADFSNRNQQLRRTKHADT